MVQILFLANPCCSSDPQFPNCTSIYRPSIKSRPHKTNHKDTRMVCSQNHEGMVEETCGKHIGIPPRIAFGGLKIAYNP